mmetsp:Transcript_2945/g.8071  ORF Transcript_2945/g.8071 Transcript_2945/m.8071 type:complete len:277 (-) Transcript_2945:254-1084(-)|eukprot:CAMPEP_0197184030 /NCGR_PEP_ID=MMETSP1423-20130617/9065_1 /TAXON_ID=476441 /ORGANISM="Pseudo-nitzschia heimii, Strain UNC1101" /LENGTH=276 /DNA_ID=CAMNT_0042634747 /DNA_START=39 /DNA_END=869 /DNA_ORIENTATION=+
MKIQLTNSVLAVLYLINGANAFAPTHRHTGLSIVDRGGSALNVNIPRLELPGVVADKFVEFDLKNPNSMNDEEYRSYSGAAIAGTLLFFLLPGALVSGIYGNVGPVFGAILLDFSLSALIGGGIAIYLSLRSDSIGETVRESGYKLLAAAKDATGIGTLRYDLPSAVTDVMTGELGLMNPNSMNEKDYDGYSGAAVAGTLLFFLLPGAFLTGASDDLGQFAGSALTDFVFSALIGGGAAIYLSLRSDEIGATVNKAGSKLLDAVDDVIGGEPKFLE